MLTKKKLKLTLKIKIANSFPLVFIHGHGNCARSHNGTCTALLLFAYFVQLYRDYGI